MFWYWNYWIWINCKVNLNKIIFFFIFHISIIEIAAVEIIDGERTGFTFSSYIKPEEPYEISPFAFECHMITKSRLQSCPSTLKILTNFLKFIEGATLVAHNASFDIRMINQELIKCNLKPVIKQKYFCTMK